MAVSIKGLDKALKDLDKKSDEVIQAVKDVLSDTAKGIELDATQNATRSIQVMRDQLGDMEGRVVDLNFNQRIDTIAGDGGFTYKTGVNIADNKFEIEAWTEFGTGLSAREILGRPEYTPEIRAVARKFWRGGQGKLIGIPYLFPAFFKNTANLVKELEQEIAKEIK
jgi:hypothetical protein